MKWVTRERPKADRIACPWLIKNFIDPEAEFLYVPAVEEYTIEDPAVKPLARIVHGADVNENRDATPQSRGLLAIAEGFHLLKLGATVPLPGPSVRFDYMSVDAKARLLYIAHMDGDELLVFDLLGRKVTARIPAPGVHGVIAVPQLGRVFASATNAREALTIDARSNSILTRAPAGLYPDGIAY